MQMHKAQTHSGSHANVAANRAHKRKAIYAGPNRAARRRELALDRAAAECSDTPVPSVPA